MQSLERDLGPNHLLRYPRMPHEADPHCTSWKAALKLEFQQLGEGTVLAGHSIGATMLMHVLAGEPPDWMPLVRRRV